MAGKRVQPFESNEGVDQPAVAYVDLGRFHRSHSQLAVKGREPTHQQEIDQQIDIPDH